MDTVLILCKNNGIEKRTQIYSAFTTLSLEAISRALSDYHYIGKCKMDPEIANMILDIMNVRFDYRRNEYPFLTAAYILGLPSRFDEFVLPTTDKQFVMKMKSSYM